MSDIVERLRGVPLHSLDYDVRERAAAEITRLRAEVAALTARAQGAEHGARAAAIFSAEEVKNLDAYQRAGRFHPFTCPNRGDGGHFENNIDLGGLIPTTRGWVCQYCDYTQDWAHDFMKRPLPPDPMVAALSPKPESANG